MADPPLPATTPLGDSKDLGILGDYRLIQRLGSGGMGDVYEAEQEHPVRRRVAIKLIKLGMDTREMVARFESERQALALLNHPHIAQVYESGNTSDGRPYFVMEHVRGVPIREYCDQNRLSVEARLRLFQQVCEGVQHAQQKGIIHRDLKSSNILVTVWEGVPQAKIIDFGLAKGMGGKLTDLTLHTQLGQVVGTLEYMSPEQAGLTPLDVDTRSDVYSLGVLLYELLVGVRPFEASSSGDTGVLELLERIRHEEPTKPSLRLAGLVARADATAAQRGTDPAALQRALRGDLDWIVLRALEKDRTRRYASPSEFAADIERHLVHEPVVASPPSTLYRVRKFVRRHRAGVAACLAVALALVAGVIGTSLMLLRATRAERSARQEAETVRRTSDFMVDLFQVSDPSEARGNTVTAREILDRGAERIRRELKDQPLVQARLMNTMGNVYRGLGLFPPSKALLEHALSVRTRTLGRMHPEVASNLNDLAFTYYRLGDYAAAADRAREAFLIHEKELGAENIQTAWSMYHLGMNLIAVADIQRGETHLRKALSVFRRQLGPDATPVAWCLNELGIAAFARGDYPEARGLLREAARIKELNLGGEHVDVAIAYNNLGYVETHLGNYADAERSIDHALGIARRSLGDQHYDTAIFLQSKGDLLRRRGRLAEAEPLLLEAVAIQEKRRNRRDPDLALSLWTLAAVRAGLGRDAEAEAGFRRSMALYEAIDPNHPLLPPCLEEFARLYAGMGRTANAGELRNRAATIRAWTAETNSPSGGGRNAREPGPTR
ncbi:MAG TPA: serine/threonine-protein kinase [Candidatus Eisenbacteria bacterium]|nr:serine/threonine-protein kinase [Candidatus Eisenbacteria bacterium]